MTAHSGIANGGEKGIIASTLDDHVITDETWKCNGLPEDGWNTCEFDDDHWQNAVELAEKGATPFGGYQSLDDLWNKYPISANAHWIWTNDSSDAVYCRKKIVSGR